MFKNVKNSNEIEYVEKDELEKTDRHQTKLFDAKIAEQQSNINQLINFISARFGEDFLDSDVNQRVENIEINLQEIEKKHKKDLEENNKTLKKEIEKQNKKIVEEIDNINNTQTSIYNKYFKCLELNENRINEVKDILSQKDKKMAQFDNRLDEYLNQILEYKENVEEEFSNTKAKINKINYSGITNKFDKMLKEQNKKLEVEIAKIENSTNKNVDDLASNFEISEAKILERVKKLDSDIQDNANKLNNIDNRWIDNYLELNNAIRNNENKSKDIEESISIQLPELKQNITDIS